MNKAYAFFCRAFQGVFRAALPILPYREPVQLDGLASIVPLLREKAVSSVLLVTDAPVRSLGLTKPLEDALKEASIACAVYDKTVPNPTIQNIEEGRALYLSSRAQAIIAVGGGSVMDCAKVIGARIAKPHQSVQHMGGLLRILRKTPMLIAFCAESNSIYPLKITIIVFRLISLILADSSKPLIPGSATSTKTKSGIYSLIKVRADSAL